MGNTVRGALLEALTPFELRVGVSADLPEARVRAALATGEMGFVHSLTPGTPVDGYQSDRSDAAGASRPADVCGRAPAAAR